MTKTYKTKLGINVSIEETSGKIPLDCPVCLLSIRDANDANSFRTHMCCAECKMDWAEPNDAAWKEGWRPSEEQLNNYRLKLKNRPTYLLS